VLLVLDETNARLRNENWVVVAGFGCWLGFGFWLQKE
jgi:hypothetical protein